ncbi:Uncharacterized protein M6B38_219250 [Iris pallida]|uniref:DUF6821 domain-containing protein n=1 Tax=Iris pallida TaxID=29817 RepID=A0AAX6DY19_IRIPA|nr:Uncharacterized protein M6B38_219250 [Iris pallida]
MERSSMDVMDIDDWELLPVPNDASSCTLFEFGLESEKDLLFSKQTNFFGPVAVVDNHYFILPSPRPSNVSSTSAEEEEEEDSSVVEFKDIGVVPPPPPPQGLIVASQAIFSKPKDVDELDDTSVWYPNLSPRGKIVPLIGHEPISFDDAEEEEEEEELYDEKEGTDGQDRDNKRRRRPCWEGFGLKVGALCSVGAAAAVTICIFVLGGHQQPNRDKYSQRLQFQIYTDDKGVKQAMQQASRLNCTLVAARGVQTRRAHISFGGHYTGF